MFENSDHAGGAGGASRVGFWMFLVGKYVLEWLVLLGLVRV